MDNPHQLTQHALNPTLSRFALNESLSDVKLIVGEGKQLFPAHKFMLASQCHYFEKLFYGEMRESTQRECYFPEDDVQAFRTMLMSFYGAAVDFEDLEHVGACLVLADKYNIPFFSHLAELKLNQLMDDMDVEQAWRIFCLVHPLQSSFAEKVLKKRILNFIPTHFEAILEKQLHFMFDKGMMVSILSSPHLSIREIDLLHAILEWSTHKGVEHYEFLKHIWWGLISSSSVAKIHKKGILSNDQLLKLYQTSIETRATEDLARDYVKVAIVVNIGVQEAFQNRPLNVQQSLQKHGFGIVDIFENETPNLNVLLQYKALFVFSLGSACMWTKQLEKYIQHGGGVVICCCSIVETTSSKGFLPIFVPDPFQSNRSSLPSDLVAQMIPSKHPIMRDVNSLKCANSKRIYESVLAKDGEVFSQWKDGRALACGKACGLGFVVTLNFYPISKDVALSGYHQDTDGDVLIANSVRYVTEKTCKFLL